MMLKYILIRIIDRLLVLKDNLDEKILFGNITHIVDPEVRKIVESGLLGKSRFQIPFWSFIYMLNYN